MTLRPLRVLLTASGAPGAARLIRALQQNGERELAVIGTDMSERSGGRFLCDDFHTVPPGLERRVRAGRGSDRRARGRRRRLPAVERRGVGSPPTAGSSRCR